MTGVDFDCEQCGQVHHNPQGRRVCRKHKSPARGGGPCSAPAMRGQEACKSHGGAAAQNRAAGEQRAAVEDARRKADAALRRLAFRASGEPVPVDKDPGEIIAEQLSIRYARVQFFAARVQALPDADLVWGRTKKKKGGDDAGTTWEAKPHGWYVLLADAERDLEKLCIAAIAAGLEERRVRIAEQAGEQLVRILDGVIAELGHNPEDPKVAGIVERHLRIVGE